MSTCSSWETWTIMKSQLSLAGTLLEMCKQPKCPSTEEWVKKIWYIYQLVSVQSLSHVQLFGTPWTAARQASLSITSSQSLLKLMSIELVMPSNHLILCCPLLLLPSIFPNIRVFSKESVLASKHVYYLGWDRSPAQVGCMRQVLGPGALGKPRGIGWRGRWEGVSGWGIHVDPRLIHVNVWQTPLQYCKVISLQLI